MFENIYLVTENILDSRINKTPRSTVPRLLLSPKLPCENSALEIGNNVTIILTAISDIRVGRDKEKI